MSTEKPPWWRAFDRVERAVGKPLEDVAASRTYVDVMIVGMKVQRKIGGAVLGAAGRAVGTVLSIANVPTRTDVRRISRELAVLTSAVRELKLSQRSIEGTATELPPKRAVEARRPEKPGHAA